MNDKERELREQLEEKLYNNFYNPKDKVAQILSICLHYMTLKQRKIRAKIM